MEGDWRNILVTWHPFVTSSHIDFFHTADRLGSRCRENKAHVRLSTTNQSPAVLIISSSSTVITHLMSSDTVAYFYCLNDTQQPKKADPEEIFRAILKQLVISCSSHAVKEKYEEAKRDGSPHGSIKGLTLDQCTEFIIQLAKNRPVMIVIDALDECRGNDDQLREGGLYYLGDLINQLEEITNACPGNIKVFLSSRDNESIAKRLRNYTNISLNVKRNQDDIRRFIEEKVDLLMRDKAWHDDGSLKEDIIKAVNDKADGMYVLMSPVLLW